MNESKARLVVEIDTNHAKRNAEEFGKALNELTSKGDKTSDAMVEMSKDIKTTTTANSKLKTEVDKSTKALSQNTEVSKRNSSALKELAVYARNTLLASTALAGGVGGLTTVLSQAATDIERYSKLTQMSTDEFQYFAIGAAKARYSMDDYAQALKDVYDRLGDVTDAQSGEMMDFFTNIAPKVGLTTEAFKGLSGQDALQLYYNSLKQLNLPHAEMVKYMEQLINDGSLLIPLLENNGEAFKKYGDEALRAGAIMSEDLIKNLNATKTEFNNVQMQAMGLVYSFTGQMLPAVKLVSENFDTLVAVGGVVAALYGGRVAVAFALSAQRAAWNTAAIITQTNVTNAATVAARGLYAALGGPVGLAISLTSVAAGYLLLTNNSNKASESLRQNNQSVKEAIQQYNELDTVKKRQQTSSEKQYLDDLSNSYKNATDKLVTNAYALTRHNDVTKEQAKAINLVIGEFKKTGDLDSFSSKINNLNFVSQESKDKFNLLAGSVRDAGVEFKNQRKFVDEIASSLNNTGIAGGNAASGIRSATNALSEYAKEALDAGKKAQITNTLLNKGYSQGAASDLAEIAAKNGKVTAKEAEAIIFKNRQLEQLNSTLENQRKQQQEATKSGKDYENQLKKNAKEAENLRIEAQELAQEINYDYGNEFQRIDIDFKNEASKINKSSLSDAGKMEAIQIAKSISEARKKLYILEYEQTVDSWKWTEEQKLVKSIEIEKARIVATNGLSKGERDERIKSLNEQSNHELALIKLAQETRVFQFEQSLLSQSVASEKYWALERERIALNVHDLTERNKQLAIANALQAQEKAQILNDAVSTWGGTQAQLNGTTDQYQLNQTRQDRLDQSAGLADAQFSMLREQEKDPNADLQLIAQQREEIWQAHTDRMKEIDERYYADSYSLQLAGMGQIASGLTSIMGDMAGEQSAAYKAMFAIEKGFAIAQSAMAIQTGVSKAIALGFPQNIPVIAQTVMEGAKIASAIRSITDTGFAGGGFTGYGGKFEPAGIVHKGEGVLNQEEIRAIGGEFGFNQLRQAIRNGYSTGGLVQDTQRVSVGAVRAVQSGGSNGGSSAFDASISIVVENHSQAKVDAVMDDERRVRVIIRDEIDKHMPSQMQNPNSRVHKSITQNTTATTKR